MTAAAISNPATAVTSGKPDGRRARTGLRDEQGFLAGPKLATGAHFPFPGGLGLVTTVRSSTRQ